LPGESENRAVADAFIGMLPSAVRRTKDMCTRSHAPIANPGSRNPVRSLTLIIGAMVAVYACDDATSPTSERGRFLENGAAAVDVTPGITTLCKNGPGATFQVRVGLNAAPQTVTVNGGSCTTVASINPASQDDVVVSIAENSAAYYSLDHVIVQHGNEAAKSVNGTNTVSFEGAHGAVVTFVNNAVVTVCKSGTNATFQYKVGVNGTAQSLSLSDGQCSTIATLPPTAAGDDVIVSVSENGSPTYRLDHMALVHGALAPQTITGSNSVSFEGLHGARVTFFNVPVVSGSVGCTFTMGYYKNKGRALLPSGNFFLSGQTWLAVLETAPKQGNAYYILAHQYIAAVLNAKSASVPSNVSGALTNATTYFGKATPGDWGAKGAYSKGQLTAWADLLDGYNNGKMGPPHCD
jgi:hypothetical protein